MADVQVIRLQKEQLENLSNIYLSDLEIQKQSHPARFSIVCHPFSDKSEDEYKIKIHLQFSNEYPRKPLALEVEALVGITSENVAALEKTARNIMSQSIGRPFVYDIVETTRKWIQIYLVDGVQQQEEQESFKPSTEVFERPKYATYTPVTLENFLNWKKAFEIQMFEQKRRKQAQIQEKMSGKQYFLKNEGRLSDDQDQDAQVVDTKNRQADQGVKQAEKQEIQQDEEDDEDDELWSPN